MLSESLENSHHGSTISTTINEQMCRLCLEEKPDMWSFFSVLTFEDKSTLDIVQAFQLLTAESVEQVICLLLYCLIEFLNISIRFRLKIPNCLS